MKDLGVERAGKKVHEDCRDRPVGCLAEVDYIVAQSVEPRQDVLQGWQQVTAPAGQQGTTGSEEGSWVMRLDMTAAVHRTSQW